MKKKTIKKLTLNKIKIGSLNNNDQAKINGGIGLKPVTDTIIINPTNPTAATWCYICPGLTSDCA